MTGAPEPSGDFLINAQGEDVVSGVRNTLDIAEMADVLPGAIRAVDGDPADARDATTATSRTWSSRWSWGACTCSRRATPSAPPRPPCASPSTSVAEGMLSPARALATIEAEKLDALLHPTFDPESEHDVHPLRRRRLAGRREGRGRLHRRGGGPARCRRPRRDPRAAVHRGRRHRRLPRGARDPHQRGRQGQPRRARRARDGRARGHGRVRAGGRPRRAHGRASASRRSHDGDLIAIDGSTGCVTTDDVPLVAAVGRRGLRPGAAVGRRAAPPRGAHQRRHARGRPTRARVRRQRHRPVPDRAHVLRRRPPRADGARDPRRRGRRASRRARRRCCRSSRATSRGSSRRWRACR